jgi:hypothetical protein
MRTIWTIPAALLALSCATPGGTVSDELEIPDYAVLEEDGVYELRRYEPLITASAVVSGDFDAASRKGFRIIAGYIFGANAPRRSIAMTAPVSTEPVAGEKIAMTAPVSAASETAGWRITFMMPSKYTLDDLPTPNDDRVILSEQPARCVASVRFSGFTTKASIAKRTEALRAWMGARGIREAGVASVERYNDPFTLPWNRRNEVLLPVDDCDV